jgi:hypothetical protein
LLQRCARWNMAVYRSPRRHPDKALGHALGARLGLRRLDANWLAEDDGISSIAVSQSAAVAPHGAVIPNTHRPIKWPTDG